MVSRSTWGCGLIIVKAMVSSVDDVRIVFVKVINGSLSLSNSSSHSYFISLPARIE